MPKEQPLPPSYEAVAYPNRNSPYHVRLRSITLVRTVLWFIFAIAALYAWFSISALSQSPRYEAEGDSVSLSHYHEALGQCKARNVFPSRPDGGVRKANPRWTPASGQNETVVLRNARLFDGERWIPGKVDIVFSKGLIQSVTRTEEKIAVSDAVEFDVHGRFVTPGLVDMHSHHLAMVWPETEATADENEMHESTKELSPAVRIIDSLKAYDQAAKLICSGGITSSLILPGSANIIGGEGIPVKNALFSGEHGEPVVEELLLEYGIPEEERHRYMKMAFGENPRSVWGHTRMGVSWHLREHLELARKLREKQDDYCTRLEMASSWDNGKKAGWTIDHGRYPVDLKLEPTVALLRGRVILQNHNYESQDMEAMIRISKEFGFKIGGFHHATEAWQVPHMLKKEAENITAAIFAEFSGYKWEAFSPSLYAGHILDKAGVRVAYKSDHSIDLLNAKYLLNQAAVAHSFLLPEEKALQAVTSTPAKALDLDFRIGYARPGYDADIAIWNEHPLALGATPLQVFVDGRPQLDQEKVKESLGESFSSQEALNADSRPQVRQELEPTEEEGICSQAARPDRTFVINGIQRAFLDNYPHLAHVTEKPPHEPLQMVIVNGSISCLGSGTDCQDAVLTAKSQATDSILELNLNNGYVTPGLTALTSSLGMREISMLDSTGDGGAENQKIDDPDSLDFAKYGIWLDGKQFARARLGGVTRAITPPRSEIPGLVAGVSVEIGTSGKKTLSDGGIIKGEVALHLNLGDASKFTEGTVSNSIKNLRKMLKDSKQKFNGTIYEDVAQGKMPLLVNCDNKYDMEQLIMVKKDFPEVNLVIVGGKEAPYIAKELAPAKVPVILTANRPGPSAFRSKDAVVGPPLSRSIASYLSEAGVFYAVAIVDGDIMSDFRIHDLLPEAAWAGKYAGLSESAVVKLVTTNIEQILQLETSKDIVVYEGNPLKYGATVVLSFAFDDATGKIEMATCYPREGDVNTIL
ncbi:hypothetical protein NLU13_4814 [Sarocladium strictum]|uniref:Amidohydrolase-related domain-containing protein n=1 Tax=Sarocladium strictum TaxID=5046 RepID=A0AA39GK86_SARSR|nr:hypothetical protein NLU13_4814 [Sarocladium strictum]